MGRREGDEYSFAALQNDVLKLPGVKTLAGKTPLRRKVVFYSLAALTTATLVFAVNKHDNGYNPPQQTPPAPTTPVRR